MNMAVDQLSSEWSNARKPVTHSVVYRPSCDNRKVLQLCRIGLKKKWNTPYWLKKRAKK
jgi:hypothetical protein